MFLIHYQKASTKSLLLNVVIYRSVWWHHNRLVNSSLGECETARRPISQERGFAESPIWHVAKKLACRVRAPVSLIKASGRAKRTDEHDDDITRL